MRGNGNMLLMRVKISRRPFGAQKIINHIIMATPYFEF